MFATHEVALLVAAVIPVAVIAGINVWLFLLGERGTLLLPGLDRFPALDLSRETEPVVEQPAMTEEELPLRKAA